MKSIIITIVSFGFTHLLLGQTANTFCCDPQTPDYINNPTTCQQNGENPFALPLSGSGNCDPDCGEIDGDDCTTIPLDGGLSLLALAGGGLATAAIRRRREEEEAAQPVA